MAGNDNPRVMTLSGVLGAAFGQQALLISGIWEAFPDVPKFWVTRPRDMYRQPIEGSPWIVVLDGEPPEGMPELLAQAGGYYLESLNLGLPLGIADGFDADGAPTGGPPGPQIEPVKFRNGRPYFSIPCGRVGNVIRALQENKVLLN